MRTCTGCGQGKPLAEYSFRKERGRYRTQCKACVRLKDRVVRGYSPELTIRPTQPEPYLAPGGEVVKECTKCREHRPIEEFYWRKKRTQYYAHCKACHNGFTRDWVSKNREYYRVKVKEYYLKSKEDDPDRFTNYALWHGHGITLDDYHAILRSQGGVCAVCGSATPGHTTKRTKRVRFVVDHDHGCCPGNRSCGQCIRGLTCHPCNRLMGQAKDDPDVLIRAATYLMSYEFMKGGDAK